MCDWNRRSRIAWLKNSLSERVVLLDGGMGTMIQQARYFNLGKITSDQLKAYSDARDVPFEVAQRWLAPVLAE